MRFGAEELRMAIFKVRMVVDMVVEAADGDEAWDAAKDNVMESDSDHFAVDSVEPVKKLADLPKGWDGMCLPYNGDGNARLKDIFGA